MTIEEQLEAELRSHDWYYMMSDDNRAYVAGSQHWSHIASLKTTLNNEEKWRELHNKYCPEEWRIK